MAGGVCLWPLEGLRLQPEQGSARFLPVARGSEIHLIYRHSVARSLVSEVFGVTPCGTLRLQRTAYHDFGAGLPGQTSRGFSHRDGMFVIDDIDLELSELPLRIGRTAEHRLWIPPGGEIRLAELFSPGSLVRVEPARRALWNFVFFGGHSSVWKNGQQVFTTVLTKK
ncbi:DUF1850 domain-containing protein [Alkalispirochaeta americana]|uniref:DUF1850 domain-containing protein n=1 Tax=Alkalispirochaeta americana TaxID=159291 RepID=UPI000970C038